MPPKKKAASNGFMEFTMEWKSKYGKHMTMKEATENAGKIWTNMNEQERAPYKEKAKEQKTALKSVKNAEKLTCTGTPLSLIEKEKMESEKKDRQMKRDIENIVSHSLKSDELEIQSYFFIMVNYFAKANQSGVYIPAEITVCEYSLKHGNKKIYHTFTNPGVNIFGCQYDAQHHSSTTHNLPLPPNAMGEKNMGRIYNDILNLIRDKKTGDYPPLYTHRDCIHIVNSVLEFFKSDIGANNVDLKIYPIQYLFFIMKETTCEVGELEKPKNIFITDAFFERDFFEYNTDIACEYHENIDRGKYCTQSYVTRWGYMFSDYMCKDIAVPLIPGRNCPKDTNLNAIITPAPSTCNDNTSYISMGTTSSYATKPVADSKIYYDDQKSTISDDNHKNKTYTNDYPALGALKKSNNKIKQERVISAEKNILECDDYSDKHLNPWSNRSRVVPPEPDGTKFSIDYNHDNTDIDDYSSVASFGRGRGSLINSTLNLSNATIGNGRGHSMRSKH